jgi:putative rhamnosyltransferase
MLNIRTIGLLRFSVLTPTYYSERFDTLEATAAHLYSKARMDLRFRIFEHLVLPTLLMQSDPDFDLVVLSGEAMPDRYKVRLSALIDQAPNFHLRFVGTDKHYPLLKQGYASVPAGDATHLIKFRLDDDDAVDLGFVARLKSISAGLHAMQDSDTPHVIAFNRGFYVRFRSGEEHEIFDACERAPLSTGTAVLAPVTDDRNPYTYNHRKLPQFYNTYSDISVPSFIRTIHGDNKSDPAQMGVTHRMRPKAINRQLGLHFNTSMDVLRAL